MTLCNRRTFLKTGSMALAATSVPGLVLSVQPKVTDPNFFDVLAAQDLKALTAAALEAAKGADASYADVHYVLTRNEGWWDFAGTNYPQPFHYTYAGFNVRALVNGYWGFAAFSGVVSLDEAAGLGRDATSQAKIASAKGRTRATDLATVPAPAQGNWVMPIEIDPFTVSYEEKADFITAMNDYMGRQRFGSGAGGAMSFRKAERTFASSEGAFTTQTVFHSGYGLGVAVPSDWLKEEGGIRSAPFMTTTGAGWEYIRNAPYRDRVIGLFDEALRSRRKKPVDVGRYDIVLDAQALASVVNTSIGIPTEADRAFGYLANESGTSYITDPLEMLGTFKIGSPLLNVTTNRSMPGGAATVKWDDEGVEPAEITLVKDGVLSDMQTTRESASWLADYYNKKGMPVRSNGCAGQGNPTMFLTQVNPNMVVAPSASNTTFEDMVKDTKKGIAVLGGSTYGDYQMLNGTGNGEITYEIVDGKLGMAIVGAQYVYRAPDFWKNLVALGGQTTVQKHAFSSRSEDSMYTISCVPGKVTGVAITDVMRKA